MPADILKEQWHSSYRGMVSNLAHRQKVAETTNDYLSRWLLRIIPQVCHCHGGKMGWALSRSTHLRLVQDCPEIRLGSSITSLCYEASSTWLFCGLWSGAIRAFCKQPVTRFLWGCEWKLKKDPSTHVVECQRHWDYFEPYRITQPCTLHLGILEIPAPLSWGKGWAAPRTQTISDLPPGSQFRSNLRLQRRHRAAVDHWSKRKLPMPWAAAHQPLGPDAKMGRAWGGLWHHGRTLSSGVDKSSSWGRNSDLSNVS